MIITVDLDQYAIIDESSMIIDDFRKSSKCICQAANSCAWLENPISNKLFSPQIVLKVRFAVLKGCFGRKFVKPQHVILKIFSESQCEQQGVELGIFNSIFDKSK